ncbi:MAG: AMP-binding protein, partial [Candidatus Eremiobacteraeota bacterium]|nr:AMP-binding protein [Candidatus Eremiobacteraeota bacterium]
AREGWRDADALVRAAAPLNGVATSPDDLAYIVYTSGTTKEPKGVVHRVAYTWATRMQAATWFDIKPDDLAWCTAGTGWAKSLWNVLLGPWSCGAPIVLDEAPFVPEKRMDLIRDLEVTVLCQAPTEYRLEAKLADLGSRWKLPKLRHCISAGEPLNPEVIERWREAFGLTILDGYGQTENTLLVANRPGLPVRPGSMGKPTPGHDVAVIDEHGRACEAGEVGDIALRGDPPSLFTEYFKNDEETRASRRGPWYVTGDRAQLDDDGYFWFVGRADDVISSGAYRIGPFEVESALLEHPAVLESAVVGSPDPDRGNVVKAFVVLRPPNEPSAALVRELQDHCKRVTAPYKYPREIEFVAELPKTRSGKIRRVELRQAELRKKGATAASGFV